MSSSSPSLGSLGIQAPSLTPQIVYVSSETCMDLSLFKAIMREYRALDDGIHMRLNRTLAFEQERLRQKTNLGKSVEAQACLRLWQELVSNWGRRNQLIEYCVTVVDQSTKVKQGILDSRDTSPSAMRKARAEEYSEQVKRDQIRNERTIEDVVKRRSVEALKSRCKYFKPPVSDEEARKLWYSV